MQDIYDFIERDMVQFSDHVVLTSLKHLLYDLEMNTEDYQVWLDDESEENLKDAVRTLIEWYGVHGRDFG